MSKFKIGLLGILAILVLVVFASGCTSNSNSNNTPNGTQTQQQNGQSYNQSVNSGSIRIIATGPWKGSISDSSGSKSVQGTGTQTYLLAKNPGTVAVSIQKDNSKDQVINGTIQPDTSTLTVQIMSSGGNVVASQSTTVDAGVVTVSAQL